MVKSKVIRNASFVSAGAVTGKLLALLTLYFTSRMLGPGNFGSYNFALVYAGYFALLADFGTTQVMIIKGAQQPANRSGLFWQIAHFRVLIGMAITVLLVISAYVITSDNNTRHAIIISSLAIPIGNISGLLGAFFISDQAHNFKVIIETLVAVAVTAVSILLLCLGYSYVSLTVIGLLGVVSLVMAQYKYLRGHGLDRLSKVEINDILKIIKTAAPFGAILFLNNLFSRIDIALIQKILGPKEVGVYSAAYKLMNNVAFIPGAVTSAMLPVMSIMTMENSQETGRLVKRAISILLSLGLPIAMLTMFWGRGFVMLYFGPGYAEAVLPLIILGWAVPLMFINSIFIHLFYAQNRLRQIIVLVSLLVLVNISFNLVLLKPMGIVGAAIATVICELSAVTYYILTLKVSLQKVLSKIPVNIYVSVMATALALLFHWVMVSWSPVAAKGVASTIVLCGMGVVVRREGLLTMLFKRGGASNSG